MKKIFFLLIFSSLFFCSCDYFDKPHYIVITLKTDSDTVFHKGTSDSWFTSKVGSTIKGSYFLIPPSNENIEFLYIKSSDDSILQVTEINPFNQTFKAIVKSQGNAKIDIQTYKYFSNSTSKIICY